MTSTARVLVSERSGGRAPHIAASLAAHGCTVTNVAVLEDVPLRATRDKPDVVVLDGRQPKAARSRVAQAMRSEQATRLIPVIVAGSADEVEGESWLDVVLPRPYAEDELVARVHALRRLATMRQELERRVETAAKFGFSTVIDAYLSDGPGALRLVAIDPSDDDLRALRGGLGGRGSIVLSGAFDCTSVLMDGGHDAAVVFAGDDPEAALEVCEAVRRMPNLFHFPLLVVAHPGSFGDAARPYQVGASDVVQRPIDAEALHGRIVGLVRQERFRSFLQTAYREGLGLVVTDGLTGLYRYGFAHEHLAAQARDAAITQRPLSVAVLRVQGIADINRAAGYATGDHVLRQYGAMVGRLVRAEDLAARIGGATFGIAMPDTSLDAAAAVCRRIAGVIANTDVGLADPGIDGARIALGCVVARPDERPEDLYARAAATPL